ncbi:MAG: hypothetical protein PHR53_06915 [Bacteroidales bacterium]|nr:hypothetical protein [Bacteroidales bacterium]
MNPKIAQIVSFIFHPVFLLFYVTLILIWTPLLLLGSVTSISQKIEVTFFILFSATLLPCLMMLVLKHFRKIQSFQMETKQERWIPYIFNVLIYSIICFFLHKIFQSSVLETFFFGMLLLQIGILIINYFWKISIHAIGIGAVTGLFVALSLIFNHTFWWFSVICMTLSLMIIFARLRLKAHSKSQVILGFLLGFMLMFILFLYLY